MYTSTNEGTYANYGNVNGINIHHPLTSKELYISRQFPYLTY